ncbi:hypothetical protein C8J56DRAFT_904057 [Mycena floridula]|nr:hypothetical protein C8J56DRAFT_904057 [Mycena floridula]
MPGIPVAMSNLQHSRRGWVIESFQRSSELITVGAELFRNAQRCRYTGRPIFHFLSGANMRTRAKSNVPPEFTNLQRNTQGYIHEVAGRLGIPLYRRNGSVFQVKVDRYIEGQLPAMKREFINKIFSSISTPTKLPLPQFVHGMVFDNYSISSIHPEITTGPVSHELAIMLAWARVIAVPFALVESPQSRNDYFWTSMQLRQREPLALWESQKLDIETRRDSWLIIDPSSKYWFGLTGSALISLDRVINRINFNVQITNPNLNLTAGKRRERRREPPPPAAEPVIEDDGLMDADASGDDNDGMADADASGDDDDEVLVFDWFADLMQVSMD